jgi:Flp pilus assembly protein TadG
MIRLLRAHLGSARRGQAAVETALVLSIIMILALGTLDLGRGIAAHIALTEATQEGATYAGYEFYDPDVSPALTQADIQQRVRTSSPSVDAVANAVVTLVDCDPYVVVHSTYPMPVISPPASLLFGPTIRISVEVEATNFHVGECP